MLGQADLKRTFPWLNIEAGDVSPEVTTCCTLTNATNQTTSTTNQRIALPTTCWIEVFQLICFHRQVTAGCYGADSEGWFDPWALLQVPFHICGVINTR